MSWWSSFVVVLVAGLPWLVGIAFYWRRRARGDFVPPSLAEMIRKRLWTQ